MSVNKRIFTFYFPVALIIGLSFRFFSFRYYANLNSDDALTILMAHFYHLPQDLFCWGQDRGGTLIPLLSQPLLKCGLTAIWAVSLVSYALLIGGYWGYSQLFKNNLYKVLFALCWFFPFQRFIDLTRFPIGVEYSLLGIAWGLVYPNLINQNPIGWFKSALCGILVIAAVWMSDLALLSLFTFYLLYLYQSSKQTHFKNKVIGISAWLILVSFAGKAFLNYAKLHASTITPNYLTINSPAQLWMGIKEMWITWQYQFTFFTKEPLVTFFAYTLTLLLLLLIIGSIRYKWLQIAFKNSAFTFFFVDFMVVIAALMSSTWVLNNGLGRWYFVAPYISFSLFILVFLENNTTPTRLYKAVKVLSFTLIATNSVSALYDLATRNSTGLKPKYDVISEFNQLGEAYIIADFWNSYLTASANPDKITATPHDKVHNRNPEMTRKVLSSPNVYIIKDLWMESFPDTLIQYNHVLVKSGIPFELGDCKICLYQNTSFKP